MAVPLPPSLWAMIDDYLKTSLTTWAEQYTELVKPNGEAHVEIAEQFDPNDGNTPLVLIRSYERKMAEGEARFGDGEFHLANMTYEYEIVLYNTFATIGEAKNFCSNAIGACIAFLRQDVTMNGLASPDGEYVLQMEFDDHEIYVRGSGGQESGKWAGAGCVRFNVTSEI